MVRRKHPTAQFTYKGKSYSGDFVTIKKGMVYMVVPTEKKPKGQFKGFKAEFIEAFQLDTEQLVLV